jgi:hypothetical protein
MTYFDDYLAKKLQDPEFKAEYDALEPEFNAVIAQYAAEAAARKRRSLPRLNPRRHNNTHLNIHIQQQERLRNDRIQN